MRRVHITSEHFAEYERTCRSEGCEIPITIQQLALDIMTASQGMRQVTADADTFDLLFEYDADAEAYATDYDGAELRPVD